MCARFSAWTLPPIRAFARRLRMRSRVSSRKARKWRLPRPHSRMKSLQLVWYCQLRPKRMAMPSIKPSWIFPALAALIGGAITAAAQDELFVSKQLTPKNEYTFQIEGPAVDRAGNLYVGNL